MRAFWLLMALVVIVLLSCHHVCVWSGQSANWLKNAVFPCREIHAYVNSLVLHTVTAKNSSVCRVLGRGLVESLM